MFKSLIRETFEKMEQAIFPAFSRWGLLTRLYYGLLVPRYAREQAAVITGRRLHARGEATAKRAALRRGIHRLEKGLVMRPRARVFAEDYILQTVQVFSDLAAQPHADQTELRWAKDVLSEYFAAVGASATIDRARAQFLSHRSQPDGTDGSAVPYPRSDGERANVPFESFLALCKQRRSVRWFLDRTIEIEKIQSAIAAASLAPSACNRQPYLFRYFDNRKEAAEIASIAMGTAGYVQQIPALIVVLGDFSSFEHERDRHLPYIDGSLAAMQLMLALETLGLASCAINWPDVEARERRIASALALPVHIRPLMLIAVGYADPAGGIPFSAKKASNNLLRTSNDYR